MRTLSWRWATKGEISKEWVINSLPPGQEAASSKYKVGQAGTPVVLHSLLRLEEAEATSQGIKENTQVTITEPFRPCPGCQRKEERHSCANGSNIL